MFDVGKDILAKNHRNQFYIVFVWTLLVIPNVNGFLFAFKQQCNVHSAISFSFVWIWLETHIRNSSVPFVSFHVFFRFMSIIPSRPLPLFDFVYCEWAVWYQYEFTDKFYSLLQLPPALSHETRQFWSTISTSFLHSA